MTIQMNETTRIALIDGLWVVEVLNDGNWYQESVGYETLQEAKENA